MQTETATSAWGYVLLRCAERRGNLLPSFVFASANFAVVLRFTEVEKIRKGMQTETAISAWGYILLRYVKRRGNLFAVVRICASKFCRRLPSPALILSYQLHMGNGNFRMGLHTSSLRGNDAATCLPSFVFASANFAVVLRFTEVKKIRKGMQTETATSAWGYILLRCVKRRGNLLAVVRICVSKFCRSSPFYESQKNPKGHANGNGNFRMGLHTSSVRGNDAATSFLYDKRFFRLNTI